MFLSSGITCHFRIESTVDVLDLFGLFWCSFVFRRWHGFLYLFLIVFWLVFGSLLSMLKFCILVFFAVCICVVFLVIFDGDTGVPNSNDVRSSCSSIFMTGTLLLTVKSVVDGVRAVGCVQYQVSWVYNVLYR